jgi:hypothetical protein
MGIADAEQGIEVLFRRQLMEDVRHGLIDHF